MAIGDTIKIAICNETFQGWPIEKIFGYVAQLGYDGVEIAPLTLGGSISEISQQRRTDIRQAAEKSGVEIIGLHSVLKKPEGLSLNHPDEGIRIRTQENIKASIHLCADLGGKMLNLGFSRQIAIQEGWGYDESWKRTRDTFERCLETARERGVTCCFEPVKRTLNNFINKVDDAVRFIREINHPNLKMTFDSRSLSVEEASLTDALCRAIQSGYLGHVHVNDTNDRGPGFGKLKFVPLLKTLVDNGYRDYISIEVFLFDPDPQTIASRSIGYLKGILETLGEEE